jgi:GAF domain-containing protein
LAGWVVKNRRAVLINDTLDDPRWLRRPWDCDDCPSRSAISVPLQYNERILGVLTLSYPNANHFTVEDMAILTTLLAGLSMLAFHSISETKETE